MFALSLYKFTVPEGSNASFNSLKLTNKEPGVVYGIKSSSQLFSVGSDGGVSFAGGDYERNIEYSAVVQARYINGLEGSTQVLVEVQDINDNEPQFNKLKLSAAVSEATEIGQTIAIFTGDDKDSLRNGQLMFSLASPSEMFAIKNVNNTGVVILISTLDFEKVTQYSISVSLFDKGSPAKRSKQNAELTVNVIDENDNSPISTSNITSIAVSDNTTLDTVIYTVTFEDRDIGSNKELEYMIMPVPGISIPFAIGKSSGNISVSAALGSTTPTVYHVFVLVKDKGIPSRQTPFTLRVVVMPSQMNASYFAHC